MTDCIRKIELSAQEKRRVATSFDGGDLSSDGGMILLRELENHLGLISGFSEQIPDPRDQVKIDHTQQELLLQRVFQIVAGYEDVNDSQTLRHDPILKLCCGRGIENDSALGSPSTLTRLENRISADDLKKLRSYFLERYLSEYQSAPKRIVLDVDAFDSETHGTQQLSMFHGYYGHKMYFPVMINDATSGIPLIVHLRAGNTHSGKGLKSTLRWMFWRIRREFPDVEIVLRGDGGFSLPEIMDICERSNVNYAFGFSKNTVLERKNADLMERARIKFCQTGKPVQLFDDVYYMAGSWNNYRRVVMKAEQLPLGPNQRFVVTNLPDPAESLYRDFYCQRAEASENRIKEFKLDIKADRMSCNSFIANQFRLYLYQLAFYLMLKLRHLAAGTSMAKARVVTFREKIIKVAVRVTQSVRRILIQFPSSCPYQHIMQDLFARASTI